MINQVIPKILLLFLVLVVSFRANADSHDRCLPEQDECAEIGEWGFSIGVGIGGRKNPILGNDDIPILILPTVSFYGKRFFWETDTFGYTLNESTRHMFNVIGTFSYEQTFFNEWGVGNFSIDGGVSGAGRISSNAQTQSAGEQSDPLSDSVLDIDAPSTDLDDGSIEGPLNAGAIDLDRLHDRNIAGLAGIEYNLDLSALSVGVQALRDVSSVHNGHEVRIALSSAIEGEKNWLGLTLGAEWKDSKTLDYYFGVRDEEVDDARHAYRVGGEWTTYVKVDWRHRLSKRWEIRSVVHNRWFGNEIKNSPIVEEDSSIAAFIGGVYHF